VAQTPSMGTVPARMETERDRGGARSDPRGSEPVDEGWTRARGRGIAGESRAGSPTQTERRADGAASHMAGARGAGSWVPRSVWTTERVAELIKQQFGVSYHPAHMSRLLKRIKYSVQQPIERASQRDEQAIATWKEQRWPELKKSPARGQNDCVHR
jgi:transposase